MAKSRHMQARMNQRAIDQQLVTLATDFGETRTAGSIEKKILSRKGLDKALSRLDRLRTQLLRARDKGGIVLVLGTDGVEITAYRMDSYDRSRSRQ